MDPISVVTGALIAGAAAAGQEVVSSAVKDAYEALNKAFLRVFSKDQVAIAVRHLDAKPDSEARQTLLKEELWDAGLGRDAGSNALAEQVLRRICSVRTTSMERVRFSVL